MIVAVIGCGAAKRAEPAPALELYTGNLFRARLGYVQRLGASRVLVASALHVLLDGDSPALVKPYELDLRRASRAYRDLWARDAADRLRFALLNRATFPSRLVVCCSGPYRDFVEHLGPKLSGIVEEPARGLSLGASLRFYARAV